VYTLRGCCEIKVCNKIALLVRERDGSRGGRAASTALMIEAQSFDKILPCKRAFVGVKGFNPLRVFRAEP